MEYLIRNCQDIIVTKKILKNRKEVRDSFQGVGLFLHISDHEIRKPNSQILGNKKPIELCDYQGFLSPSEIGMGVRENKGYLIYNKQWVHKGENLDKKVLMHCVDGKINIYVRTIDWEVQHTPVPKWVLVRRLSFDSTIRSLEKSILQILVDNNYFVNCGECGDWVFSGHAFNEQLCNHCAEDRLVY